jgi:hypothetical protein
MLSVTNSDDTKTATNDRNQRSRAGLACIRSAGRGDRTSAEPVIHGVTNKQLVRKTARRKKGGIEIEGCGKWVECLYRGGFPHVRTQLTSRFAYQSNSYRERAGELLFMSALLRLNESNYPR